MYVDVGLFETEFFIAFGIGMLISGCATGLYHSKERIKRVLKILDYLVGQYISTCQENKVGSINIA